MVVAIICAVQLIIGMSHLQHRGEKASLVWCEASGQIVNLLVSGGTFVVVFVVVEARTPRIDCMASRLACDDLLERGDRSIITSAWPSFSIYDIFHYP